VSNVDSVFVAGQAKKRDGKLLADVDKARADIEASRDYLLSATAEKRQRAEATWYAWPVPWSWSLRPPAGQPRRRDIAAAWQ
jgi:hypothetical protein